MSTIAEQNLARLGEEALERRGDYKALWFEGRWHRSTELFERSSRLAVGLRDSNVAFWDLDTKKPAGGFKYPGQPYALAFAVEGERLPSGTDAVVVARREAHALAEREGLEGVRAALADLVSRAIGGEAEVEGSREVARRWERSDGYSCSRYARISS